MLSQWRALMMIDLGSEVRLMGHLFRRAGFGATKSTLEEYTKLGYEETVNQLIHPLGSSDINDALVRRYFPDQGTNHDLNGFGSYALYRLVCSQQPLQEKMSFFWNNIFATGYAKVNNGKVLGDQIRMFRRHGLGTLDNLLLELSRDPAMIIWLDNIHNHKGAINENYGRELLELFSMGVGNYTEDDIKECSRAFTGWTVDNPVYTNELSIRNSIYPYGKIAWRYQYDEADHDNGQKTFLGETGNFNGEDVIRIICEQPATARFISRHLYHFFVADEPPVTQWPHTDPQDMNAINILEKAYFDTGHSISGMLEVLFNSDFFKSEDCRYKKIKSPIELVTSVLRITDEFAYPSSEIVARNTQSGWMGQLLSAPPSVEGWHQGLEWIETGSMTERVNFSAKHLGDLEKMGIKTLVKNILDTEDQFLSSETCVDYCLDQLGAIEVTDYIKDVLVDFAKEIGIDETDKIESRSEAEDKIAKVLGLIGSVPEYQRN